MLRAGLASRFLRAERASCCAWWPPHQLTQLAQGVALVAARFLELQPAVGATVPQPGAWASAARDIAVRAGASATFAQRVSSAEGAATTAPWPHRDSHERTAPRGVVSGAETAVANAAIAHAVIKEDMYPHRAVLGMAPPNESFAVAPQIERPSAHLEASAAAADDRPTEPAASNRAAATPSAHASAESIQEPTTDAAPAPLHADGDGRITREEFNRSFDIIDTDGDGFSTREDLLAASARFAAQEEAARPSSAATPVPAALPAHDAGAKPPSVEGAQRPSPPLERRSSRVPVSTMERMARFTGLGLSIAAGTVSSLVGNTLRGTYAASGGLKGSVLSEANSERLTLVLCRMRGAALKFGQLLSIQVASRRVCTMSRVCTHTVRM